MRPAIITPDIGPVHGNNILHCQGYDMINRCIAAYAARQTCSPGPGISFYKSLFYEQQEPVQCITGISLSNIF